MIQTFTKEQAERLARGWPWMVVPLDDHPHDKKPEKAALKAAAALDPTFYRSEWPRDVLYRRLRTGLGKVDAKKLATKGPLSADEAADFLTRTIAAANDDHTYPFHVRDFVFGLETIIGSDAALEHVTMAFEKADTKLPPENRGTPLHTYTKTYAAGTIAFLILRASDSARSRLLPRLETQYARFAEAAKTRRDWVWCAEHLDLSLHGSSAVRRAIERDGVLNLEHLDYAADASDLVRDEIAKDKKQPITVRAAAIAGPSALEGLAARKFPAKTLPFVVRDFAMLRANELEPAMKAWKSKKAVAPIAEAWLRSSRATSGGSSRAR